MANHRTVDPTGATPASNMVSFRMDPEQTKIMDHLCKLYDCSRSSLFRRLLMQAAAKDAVEML
jgi:hypothetical protein